MIIHLTSKPDRMKGDLSRRQIIYDMPGLSFREYLLFKHGMEIPAVPFERLLTEHAAIAEDVCRRIQVDDTEIGSRHRIPLWMFGLLY